MELSAFVPPVGPVCSSSALRGAQLDCRRPRRSPLTPTAVMGSRVPATQSSTGQESTFQVKVMQSDRCTIVNVDRDTDLRRALMAEKVDLYTLGGKLRNCGGAGQCGTCVIAVEDGVYSTNGRTPKEEFLLDGKPANFRLACRTLVNGDCTIRVKPKA